MAVTRELAIIDQIRDVLNTVFGIPSERVDRADEVAGDWGLVGHERDAFEAALYREFPKCCESFRDCVTIEDFARMVAP
jgi:hypothetical protein